MTRIELVEHRKRVPGSKGSGVKAGDGVHYQAACPTSRLPLGLVLSPTWFYDSAPRFISRVETIDRSVIVKLELFVPVLLSRSRITK